MTDHFSDRAAFIAALPDDDAERTDALAHAASCMECRQALERGEHLIARLDALPPPEPPSSETLARVAGAIRAELEAEQAAKMKRTGALAALLAWGLVALVAKRRAPEVEAWAASLAVAFVAVLVVVVAGALATIRWSALVLASASAFFALWAGTAAGLDVSIGVKCTLTELVASLVPLVGAYVMARRGGPWSVAGAATSAAAGALAGHAALHLTCPVRFHEPHLLLFHTGGVLLAAALGGLTTRLVAVKAR